MPTTTLTGLDSGSFTALDETLHRHHGDLAAPVSAATVTPGGPAALAISAIDFDLTDVRRKLANPEEGEAWSDAKLVLAISESRVSGSAKVAVPG